MACYPSLYCPCCGGVCATDETRGPWKPSGAWPQKPVEVPGPDYLDRYRNYRRPPEEDDAELPEEPAEPSPPPAANDTDDDDDLPF